MRSILLILACTVGLAAPPARLTEILILYDNTVAQPGLTADWGFAALVSHQGRRVLLDTGAKAEVFMSNLQKLGIDPASLEHVLISHAHADHTGGLAPLRAANPRLTVYQPAGAEPFEIVPGVYSTGVVSGPPSEQALVIDTPKGLVVITGCSHPGAVRMVEAAQRTRGKDAVRLLLGGFHMLGQSEAQIKGTIAALKRLSVNVALPTHCSGELALKLFRAAFGPGPGAGAGRLIVLD